MLVPGLVILNGNEKAVVVTGELGLQSASLIVSVGYLCCCRVKRLPVDFSTFVYPVGHFNCLLGYRLNEAKYFSSKEAAAHKSQRGTEPNKLNGINK